MNIVGFLRGKDSPTKLAKLLSFTCEFHGIKLLYMTPNGINMETGMTTGKMLIGNKWEEVTVKLPSFIDVNPYLFTFTRFDSIMEYLKRHTELSITRSHIMRKDKLQKELKKHPELHKYGIPSENIDTFEKFLDFIHSNNDVVVKPIKGFQGRSVNLIRKLSNDQYIVGAKKVERTINESQLFDYYNEKLKNNNYMIQKYIISRTKQGDPFDCRIHMEKGKDNKWEIANIFVRVGLGQSVVSNINQGGGISKIKPFLKNNYEESAQKILKELHKVAIDVPTEIEKITNSNLMTIGLDVGIDPNGNLYLFEVNGFPIVAPQLGEVTMLRAQYYRYMLEKTKHSFASKG